MTWVFDSRAFTRLPPFALLKNEITRQPSTSSAIVTKDNSQDVTSYSCSIHSVNTVNMSVVQKIRKSAGVSKDLWNCRADLGGYRSDSAWAAVELQGWNETRRSRL